MDMSKMSKMKQTSELQSPRAFPEVTREIEFFDLIGAGDFIILAADVHARQYSESMVLLAEDGDGKFTTTTNIISIMDIVKFRFDKCETPFVAQVKQRRGKDGRTYTYLA